MLSAYKALVESGSQCYVAANEVSPESAIASAISKCQNAGGNDCQIVAEGMAYNEHKSAIKSDDLASVGQSVVAGAATATGQIANPMLMQNGLQGYSYNNPLPKNVRTAINVADSVAKGAVAAENAQGDTFSKALAGTAVASKTMVDNTLGRVALSGLNSFQNSSSTLLSTLPDQSKLSPKGSKSGLPTTPSNAQPPSNPESQGNGGMNSIGGRVVGKCPANLAYMAPKLTTELKNNPSLGEPILTAIKKAGGASALVSLYIQQKQSYIESRDSATASAKAISATGNPIGHGVCKNSDSSMTCEAVYGYYLTDDGIKLSDATIEAAKCYQRLGY